MPGNKLVKTIMDAAAQISLAAGIGRIAKKVVKENFTADHSSNIINMPSSPLSWMKASCWNSIWETRRFSKATYDIYDDNPHISQSYTSCQTGFGTKHRQAPFRNWCRFHAFFQKEMIEGEDNDFLHIFKKQKDDRRDRRWRVGFLPSCGICHRRSF